MKTPIFLLLLFIFISCTTTRFQKSKEGKIYVLYDKSNVLNWDDFKAIPYKKSEINGYLSVTLYLSQGVDVWWGYKYFESHSAIFPYESWVKDSKHTDYYLSHFKTWFSIAEIYAKKLLQYLKENKVDYDDKPKITEVFNQFNKEYLKREKEYLDETKDALDTLKQLDWNDKIEKELREMK
ncbi:MAG: hypothetical protein EPN82_10165 [Bacteroidetes bacterium]|nr:MAG: hypothetical protein EPN82_10165 [Bacteroidota bacterium]